jgi:hypothetical protein
LLKITSTGIVWSRRTFVVGIFSVTFTNASACTGVAIDISTAALSHAQRSSVGWKFMSALGEGNRNLDARLRGAGGVCRANVTMKTVTNS